jgi:hypothetical protein
MQYVATRERLATVAGKVAGDGGHRLSRYFTVAQRLVKK